MKAAATRPLWRATDAPADAAPDRILDELEDALRHELDRFGLMDPDAADEIDRRLIDFARLVRICPPADPAACAERLRLIEKLHTRLAIRLALQRDETAARLARLRQGKATLRAYRHNT